MELIWLASGWALFGTIHSVLINDRVARYFSARLNSKSRYYRLIYNAIAVVLLVPVVLYESHISADMTSWLPELWPLRLVLLAIGISFFIAGARQYSPLSFLGIDQIRTGRSERTLSKDNHLVTAGVLKWVRHPWYTGVLCLLAARPLTPVSLTSDVVLFAYVIIGTKLEEQRLVGEFGDAYRRYQARVPMYIPWSLGGALSRYKREN